MIFPWWAWLLSVLFWTTVLVRQRRAKQSVQWQPGEQRSEFRGRL